MIQSPPSKTQLTGTTRPPTKVRIEEARPRQKQREPWICHSLFRI